MRMMHRISQIGRRTFCSLAVYDPTPSAAVCQALRLAALKPGERFFDLGSGDGRSGTVLPDVIH